MATGGDPSAIRSEQTDIKDENTLQNFSKKTLKFVVIGKTGTGISFTANAILNKKYFTSKASKRSITTELRRGESISITNGMKTVVFDTPGMFNTYLTTDEVKSNLKKSVDCVSPGQYALIYVLPLRGQMNEDRITLKEMINVFGEEMFRSIIIVFTDSEISDVINNCTLEEYLKDMPDYIIDLINRCEKRYTVLSFDGDGISQNGDNDVYEPFLELKGDDISEKGNTAVGETSLAMKGDGISQNGDNDVYEPFLELKGDDISEKGNTAVGETSLAMKGDDISEKGNTAVGETSLAMKGDDISEKGNTAVKDTSIKKKGNVVNR
ncbi:GTPase IMAP family member 4-like [Mytilus trossulus]|uniref:GTPase IMAP family member 4-like n=1 Tax=Mytilus trossulus TaxID=6551 RepID=UPI00300570CE